MIFAVISKFVFNVRNLRFSHVDVLTDRHTQSVVTLKIYNSGLDRFEAIHFLTLVYLLVYGSNLLRHQSALQLPSSLATSQWTDLQAKL